MSLQPFAASSFDNVFVTSPRIQKQLEYLHLSLTVGTVDIHSLSLILFLSTAMACPTLFRQ